MPHFLAKTIPGRWSKAAAVLLAVNALHAAPAPRDLASLVREYRESPTAVRRAAVVAYAAAHPKEAALAKLALGVAAVEQEDYSGAIAALSPITAVLPKLADYVTYYLGAARVESQDSAPFNPGPVYQAPITSPFAARARLLEARSLMAGNAAGAVALLREHYSELPQPDGDLWLGHALQAAGEPSRAAEYFQSVYYRYPTAAAASKAEAALLALRDAMGASYPEPESELLLARGDRLLETREYTRAKSEFQSALSHLEGIDRDRARVRAAAAELLRGNATAACDSLRAFGPDPSEADAERLYYLVECARRRSDDEGLLAAIGALETRYRQSRWRLRALISAGNRYLLVNRPQQYVPLYRAVYEDFPDSSEAPLCHWKVAFAAHLERDSGAEALLREHVSRYPRYASAGAALYFLGRRAEESGDSGGARAFYARIDAVYPNHFYGVLARERLSQQVVLPVAASNEIEAFLSGVEFSPREAPVLMRTPKTEARIERSRLLRRAGLSDLAEAELRFGARADGQPWVLGIEAGASAEAVHIGLRAIKAMAPGYLSLPLDAAPEKFWQLLFPMPWRLELTRNARQKQLDAFVLAGLIRQESEFNPRAVSRARAYGLTQVLPSTGRMFARREGYRRLTTGMLMQPSTNLKVGTAILRSMFDRHAGKWEQTLAAYNAGPSRVAEWITWHDYREPAEFIEAIPFTETREYVKAVLRNADLYRRIYQTGKTEVVAEQEAAPKAPAGRPAAPRG
jgi:soluble lytic murein transglycosylase